MRIQGWASVLIVAVCACAQTTPAPVDRAREAVEWVLHGEYDTVYAHCDAQMQQAASVEAWRKQVAPLVAGFGKFLSFGEPVIQKVVGNTVVVLPARFEKASINFTVAVAADGRLSGFFLRPGATTAAAQSASARAREAVEWLLAGEYQRLYDASTPHLKELSSVEKWKTTAGPIAASLGKLIEFGEPRSEAVAGGTGIALPAKFEKGDFEFNVIVEDGGAIAALYVRPAAPRSAYTHPSYSQPASFVEREMSVGADEWKLPATLTLPKNGAKLAAVVLVHGSGPHDRDETTNANNKPFRDLAEGLATQGVAVLRYEKRTQAHQAKLLALQHFTPQEETVEDAVRAAALLATVPEVDPKRIYVLGHSLGGYLLPQILKQAPQVAGGISLAGSTRPLEDLMVEQYDYLVPLQAGDSAEGKKALADVRAGAAEVKALNPGQESGAQILQAPRSYWLALQGYNPPALAATLKARWLILQGERDYQVTMTDFANWKAALGGRPGVTLKSYPALNHLFQEGVGKSKPAEYTQPGHVAAEVVDDIAKWVKQ
jgi:dienelactone hydrolase